MFCYMRMRRFYAFYGGMVEVIRGYFLSCGDIWCSILVYHYLFAVCALLVSLCIVGLLVSRLVRRLFAFCCTFFCLVVYCAALPYWSNKAWFYMLLCSARSKIEVIRIMQTAFHFERLKLCLISALLFYSSILKDIVCRVPVSRVWL